MISCCGCIGEVKINASVFVAQNAGKLRDYYRIGKMLGSGKQNIK